MDKQQLQQDIEIRKSELDTLKAQILSTQETTIKQNLEEQKKQLEEEIQVLEDRLQELEDLEKKSTITTTQEEINELKNNIDTKWTYRLITGTKMHTKLLSVLDNDESKVEKFAGDIDKVVRKFLDQELEGFSDSIKNSMSVGIQFAMMETLIEQGADGSAEFFSAFSKTDTDKGSGKAFEGLYKSFGKLGSANKFFTLAKKVQNLTRYISDKKSVIEGSTSDIPELVNPYQFKQLLTQNIWLNQAQIENLDVNKVFTLNSTEPVDIRASEDKLKEIINGNLIEGVITEKTIGAIQKSLQTADKLLDSREKFNDTATDLIDKISGILNINLPIFGNLGELMGMDFPTDILGEKDTKKGGLISFILGIFGFRGGLQGLHRKYIQEKLDEMDIDNTFIAAAYEDFQKDTDATITHDSDTSTWKLCGLSVADAATETAMKAKIPADYSSLKTAITNNISPATLHPTIVQKFAPHAVDSTGDVSIVDTSKITETDIDAYLKYIIPKLAADDFIASDKVDQNAFILAVIGGLTGDKYFIEGVNIGLLTVTDFYDIDYTSKNITQFSYKNIEDTHQELIDLAETANLDENKNRNYAEIEIFKNYLHTLEANNTLPYGIMLNLMEAESSGKLYKADGNIIGSSAGAKGLFQFMPGTAKIYIKKLGYPETDYEKIFTNPIIGAKACAQFLKDRQEAGDDVPNMLAHYNAGPGVIGGQKITIQNFRTLPNETQRYVCKIGYTMLIYANKAPIITQAQSKDPTLISSSMLQKFFDIVNTIPAPGEQKEQQIFSPDILAKNFDKIGFLGDSHVYGFTQQLGKLPGVYPKEIYSDSLIGYDSGQLLQHINENKNTYDRFDSLVLGIGANDVSKQKSTDQILKNLEAIREVMPSKQLILITVTYANPVADPPPRTNEQVDKVNTIIREFAKKHNFPVIDVASELSFSSDEYKDNVHFTSDGYRKIAEYIYSCIT